MRIKGIAQCLVAASLAMLLGCAVAKPAADAPAPVDLAREEAAIRATDAQWLAAAKARDVEKSVSFWSDDATILQPDTPPIVGKAAIRKYVTEAFASPDFSITFTTDNVVVARSGDMAYETGKDVMTFRDDKGKLITLHNRGVVVWRKQAEGSWKAAIDTWNAAPLTAVAPREKQRPYSRKRVPKAGLFSTRDRSVRTMIAVVGCGDFSGTDAARRLKLISMTSSSVRLRSPRKKTPVWLMFSATPLCHSCSPTRRYSSGTATE